MKNKKNIIMLSGTFLLLVATTFQSSDVYAATKSTTEKTAPADFVMPVVIGDLTDPSKPPTYAPSDKVVDISELSEKETSSKDTKTKGSKKKMTKKKTTKKTTKKKATTKKSAGKITKNNKKTNANQVYDPAFGWITPSDTIQDTIDSDGDINKMVGDM